MALHVIRQGVNTHGANRIENQRCRGPAEQKKAAACCVLFVDDPCRDKVRQGPAKRCLRLRPSLVPGSVTWCLSHRRISRTTFLSELCQTPLRNRDGGSRLSPKSRCRLLARDFISSMTWTENQYGFRKNFCTKKSSCAAARNVAKCCEMLRRRRITER